MPFDCVRSNHQFLGDFLVGQTLRQQVKHFAFAVGQRSQFTKRPIHQARFFNYVAEQGTIECLLFDVGRDGVLGIDFLYLFGLSSAADDNRGNLIGTCASQ